jgi:restriction system protein
MALWLVRTGAHGEHEQRFLNDARIYATWEGLNRDLRTFSSKQDLSKALQELLGLDAPKARADNYARQLWPFAQVMQPGDWVVVPYKTKPALNIAEITGPYAFNAAAEDPYYHSRDVKWIAKDIPRTNFDADLLYSIGAFMTICQIERNNAEARVRAMAATNWKSQGPNVPGALADSVAPDSEFDLEQAARDQIAKSIISKYKGHGLARLVDAVLRAQGYTTYVSPEGPDKGIDILAALGPLGFGQPRICVQVKSNGSPVDLPTMNRLIGSMANVQADQGLLVSWGGFKSTVDRERAAQFFRVRLWDQSSLIDEILVHYDDLDEEIKTELPLKRIWTIAADVTAV